MNIIIAKEPIFDKITQLYNANQYDEIGNLEGMEILESRIYEADKKYNRDCIWYVKKKLSAVINDKYNFAPWEPKGYEKIQNPKVNDIIIYHTGKNGSMENHIGIYYGNNIVISKFGYGHIYKHHITDIPTNYGPYYSFFSRILDPILEDVPTIKNIED